MDSNKESIEVRSQKSEVRIRAATVRERTGLKSEVRSRKKENRRRAGLLASFLVLLLFPTGLRTQTVNLGGTGALGSFTNPLNVVATDTKTCTYDLMQIDMNLGTVKVRPFLETNGATYCNTTLVDITSQFPNFPASGGFPTGVFEFTDFTLRQSNAGTRFDNVTLTILPNTNNTPVWIRATGNVTINGSQYLDVAGENGATRSGFLRGAGGRGGPGGYRGGDGGNGFGFPSNGSQGFGPGGGAGGAKLVTTGDPPDGAHGQLLTTGTTRGGTVIPAGNDLLTALRGGSGGGGGGGSADTAGGGGGGGGGAISIAANGTITINGYLNAQGGYGGGYYGGEGSGGVIRLVAATIAGTGPIDASSYSVGGPGIVRLEAFTISHSGPIYGPVNVLAASAPGQVLLPNSASVSAFLKITKIVNTANASEFRDVSNVPDLLTKQDIAGRTGVLNPVDATMPDLDATPISTVDVEFEVGPCPGFPTGKNVTLVVTPLDPAQGASANYTTTTPADCAASPDAKITGVALPLGYSSMSAFTVLSIATGGALAQMFPKTYQGEEIENVRIEASSKGTEYVLIAKSGKEFPYQPGR